MSRFVLITRHPADCADLQEMLAPCGVTLRPYPVLRLEEVEDETGWAAVLESTRRRQPPEWIVMASPRAPGRFVERCREQSLEGLLELPVAVVGRGTAAAATGAGLEPDIIGPGTGAGLARELLGRLARPSTVVFACGHHRRPELPEALQSAGHTVLPVVVYRMRATPPRELPPLGPSLEAVVVTSPRAARLYLDGVGGRPLPCPHWALGPTTRDAARSMGIDCLIPPEPNLGSLAEELCRISTPTGVGCSSRPSPSPSPRPSPLLRCTIAREKEREKERGGIHSREYEMSDLITRPRRLRTTAALRDLVAESRLDEKMFVQPHFVVPGEGVSHPIDAMPGIDHQSVDRLLETVASDLELGIRAALVFGVPDESEKTPDGSAASADGNVVATAVAALKDRFGDGLTVMTDVCLCAYTDHGHCGLITDGRIDNDASLPHLAAMALSHARAGADVVAPSDMMDGRIAAIRDVLDDDGLVETAIMSYSVKYASAYYGPFREAAHSAPAMGDRRSYQMDARNRREALLEAQLDVEEGADMLMVKPALAYLDVVSDLAESFPLPLAVYNVSGEYSMVKAAAERGWIDERAIVLENWHAFRRAGADILITYHGRQALRESWL